MELARIGGDWRLLYSTLSVECQDMPRLSDDFLDCVLYLYRSTHEANEGINPGGSGFLLAVPSEIIPHGKFIYAVTNCHVLAAADVLRLHTQEGGMHIERVPRELWIRSKTDDLAIQRLCSPLICLPTSIFLMTFC